MEKEVLTNKTGVLHHGPTLPILQQSLLPKMIKTQISWWDKWHIEQHGGKVDDKMYQYSFRSDKDGNFFQNVEYKIDLFTKTAFKYPKQGEFLFGIAKPVQSPSA